MIFRGLILLVALSMLPAHAENYTVVYDDGTVQTGDEILNSYAWSYVTNSPAIGGEALNPDQKTIRYIRENARHAKRIGPYIRMANGDVLPGVITGLLIVTCS